MRWVEVRTQVWHASVKPAHLGFKRAKSSNCGLLDDGSGCGVSAARAGIVSAIIPARASIHGRIVASITQASEKRIGSISCNGGSHQF
jgi:hypothetical protein